MRNFGFHNNNINGLRNAGLTRVTATLLNIRNLIETGPTQAVPAVFENEYRDSVVTSWGNRDALSVGFMTDPAVLGYTPDYDKDYNVFDKTNKWVTSMGAGNVYKPVKLVPDNSAGGLTTADSNTEVLVYVTANGASKGDYTLKLNVENADIGSDVYVYANAKKGGHATVKNGDSTLTFEIRSYQIICLGIYDGTPIELSIKYSDSPGSALFVYGYQLDQQGYAEMLDVFSDEQLEVTSYDTTSLSGHIDVREDGLLFLSIPYSEGWSAVVDGKSAEIVPIQDALMGIMLEKGSHDVSIKYTPAGFREGALISSVSAVFILLFIAVPAIFRKIRINKAHAAAVTENTAIEEVPVTEIMEQKTPETEDPVSVKDSGNEGSGGSDIVPEDGND